MEGKTAKSKRKDKVNLTLRKGESQRPNGGYDYRWTDKHGKRHALYAKTLEELRSAEVQVQRDQQDGIKAEVRNVTLNDMYELWKQLKRGLKDNTFQNYQYMYRTFVQPSFGRKKISALLKSDLKRFYNTLVDERGLSVSTVDSVHTVLHQLLEMAVDDNYIRHNPADNVLKELKQSHVPASQKQRSLTKEQERLLGFLKKSTVYGHWYPVFAVMLGTGMRVGETVGLRWCDIDMEQGVIDVNHTLVYYQHETNGCYCNIHTPKTKSGIRQIPMLELIKEAFVQERRRQFEQGIRCNATIDGYTDFIFVNRFGDP